MSSYLSFPLTLALCAVPMLASAAPVGRMAFFNAGNSRWSRANERGQMAAIRQGIGSNEVFSISDVGRGQITIARAFGQGMLQVSRRSPFAVSADATSSKTPATRFQLVEAGGGFYGLKSLANGQFVRAQADGAWTADSATASAPQTRFRLDSCQVDMWQALTAFAVGYPGKVKVKSDQNPPGNVRVTAEMMKGPYHYWYQVIEDFTHDPIGHPVYDKNAVRYIGDWECWVIYGTLPQFIPGLTWTEGIPRTRRFCDPTIQEDSPHQFVNWYDIKLDGSPGNHIAGDEWGRRFVGWEQDLSVGRGNSQVNMGHRWVMRTSYKDNLESWVVDLGPKVGTFAPRYGTVGYVNEHGVFLWFNNIQNAYDINPCRVAAY